MKVGEAVLAVATLHIIQLLRELPTVIGQVELPRIALGGSQSVGEITQRGASLKQSDLKKERNVLGKGNIPNKEAKEGLEGGRREGGERQGRQTRAP